MFLLPFTPGDYLFVGHHIMTAAYMIMSLQINRGGLSCLILMALGESTSLFQNSWLIARELRRDNQVRRHGSAAGNNFLVCMHLSHLTKANFSQLASSNKLQHSSAIANDFCACNGQCQKLHTAGLQAARMSVNWRVVAVSCADSLYDSPSECVHPPGTDVPFNFDLHMQGMQAVCSQGHIRSHRETASSTCTLS